MTLLTICQDACDEMGIVRPGSITGSSDQTARQLLALANREGRLLARRGDWTVLTKEHTFNTANGTASYALPSDYDRILNDTTWDRANYWQHRGPLSAPVWQQIKSGLISTANLHKGFRIKGSSSTRFFIDPTPTSTDAQVFEYISNQWCESSGGTDQSEWAADTDVGLLDEDLMTLGLVWRFLRAKGLDYAEEFRTYEMEVAKALARDGGKPKLVMDDRGRYTRFDANLPDGDYTL